MKKMRTNWRLIKLKKAKINGKTYKYHKMHAPTVMAYIYIVVFSIFFIVRVKPDNYISMLALAAAVFGLIFTITAQLQSNIEKNFERHLIQIVSARVVSNQAILEVKNIGDAPIVRGIVDRITINGQEIPINHLAEQELNFFTCGESLYITIKGRKYKQITKLEYEIHIYNESKLIVFEGSQRMEQNHDVFEIANNGCQLSKKILYRWKI